MMFSVIVAAYLTGKLEQQTHQLSDGSLNKAAIEDPENDSGLANACRTQDPVPHIPRRAEWNAELVLTIFRFFKE
jgi:hypothetical protein